MGTVFALRSLGLSICALGLIAEDASCVYPPTEVLVFLDTDAPLTQPLTIVATVRLGAALSGTGTVHRWVRGAGVAGSIRLPGSFAIVPPASGNIDLPVSVVIDASLAAVNPADRPLQFRVIQRLSFTRNQTTYIRIFLSTQCGGLATGCNAAIPALCTIAQLCEDRGQTCGEAGRCVPQAIVPQPLVDAGATTVDGSRSDVRSDGSTDVSMDGGGPDAAQDSPNDAVIDAPDTGMTCDAGRTPCAMACVDLNTSLQNCGACGNVCTIADNDCVSGACSCTGVDPRVCGGRCLDVDSNLLHCGSCSTNCQRLGFSRCRGGACL